MIAVPNTVKIGKNEGVNTRQSPVHFAKASLAEYALSSKMVRKVLIQSQFKYHLAKWALDTGDACFVDEMYEVGLGFRLEFREGVFKHVGSC